MWHTWRALWAVTVLEPTQWQGLTNGSHAAREAGRASVGLGLPIGQGLGGGGSLTRRGGVKVVTQPARWRSFNGDGAPVVFGGDGGLLQHQ
jgi:hypothetical protein